MKQKLKSISIFILAICLAQSPFLAMTEGSCGIDVACAEENKAPLPDQVTIDKALIKEIDVKNNKVTILPDGMKDRLENYIVLNAGEQTRIKDKNNRPISIKELKKGMNVRVTHAAVMQPSIPPQTPVFEITILAE